MENEIVDIQKRAFMKKFGKYATVGAGMSLLMTPTLSSAQNYCNGNAEGSWRSGSHAEGTWEAKQISSATNEEWDGDWYWDNGQYKSEGNVRFVYGNQQYEGVWEGTWSRDSEGVWHGTGYWVSEDAGKKGQWVAQGDLYDFMNGGNQLHWDWNTHIEDYNR